MQVKTILLIALYAVSQCLLLITVSVGSTASFWFVLYSAVVFFHVLSENKDLKETIRRERDSNQGCIDSLIHHIQELENRPRGK